MKNQFLWLIPFLAFAAGYYCIFQLVSVEYTEIPCVVGFSLKDALKAISDAQLQGQIIAEKEEESLPDGLVLDQSPRAGQKMKQSQAIHLTIAKKPHPLRAPHFFDLDQKCINEKGASLKIRVKYHLIESNYPPGRCYAQYPSPGDIVEDRTIHIYLSLGATATRIFPYCKGLPLESVKSFLEEQGIPVQVFHDQNPSSTHDCTLCTVRDQKPLAGTIFDLNKPVTVQLIAE